MKLCFLSGANKSDRCGISDYIKLIAKKLEELGNEIVIINNGSVYINNELFNINNLDDVEQAIFNLDNNSNVIILSAESDSLHVWVISIMDILNKYGFDEVQIRTIEK